MINILKRVQVDLEAREHRMERTKSIFKRLPWRIIKTTISVIVAIAILPGISYLLFKCILPIYPFIFSSHNETIYIGSTSTALYFTAMAATKGVGNTLTSTWKAISSQMISNFFGAVMGVVISSTLAEVLGPTNPFTIGIGIFILYVILKRLKLNDAFTLGGITFITIVILSSADYPPLVRGVDRFYSMAVGLIVSAIINIIFLSPKKSVSALYTQLLHIQKRFCLQTSLNGDDYQSIEKEMREIQKDTTILVQDEKIERKIFLWRKDDAFNRHLLARYVKQSELLLKMDMLKNEKYRKTDRFDVMYSELKQQHYTMIEHQKTDQLCALVETMRDWLFANYKQIEKIDIVQFLDYLNQYEQLLVKE